MVLTNLPFRSTIHKLDLSERMARWAVQLSEYGIQYKPRLAKNGQVLADLSNQQLQGSEKGKVPFQSQQHQKGVHEIGLTNDPNARIDEVKAVVTLRSGKELRPAVPALVKSAPTVADPPQEEQSASREEVKISVPPPFPQALQKKKFR